MIVADEERWTQQGRFLATQARDAAPHYQHSQIGFNYRMSNVAAAIGRGQLETLEQRVMLRRGNFEAYLEALGNLPGVVLHARRCLRAVHPLADVLHD